MSKKKTKARAAAKQSTKDIEPVFMLPYKKAFLGYAERFGQIPPRVAVYDTEKVIKILKKNMTMITGDEAHEDFYFNILGAWLGDGTPIFVTRMTQDEFINDLKDGGEI